MKTKGNILSFKFTLVLGGGERFNFLIGEELSNAGYNIKFFSNYKPFIKRLRSLGLNARRLYWGKEVGAIRNIPEYFFMLPFNIVRFFFLFLLNKKRGVNNIVIFQNLNEKIFATKIAKKFGYKVFWIEHLSIDSWLTKNILKNSYIRNVKEVDKIIVISETIKKDLISKLNIDSNKIETIYSGVDLKRFFVFKQNEIENEKKRYGFYKGAKIIGYVGRLHSEKGLDILINSFYQLSRRFDHIYLLIVGDGPEKKKLEKMSFDLGMEKKILFFGYKENIPLFLNTLDIFVLPSRIRESFGIVLIEAMAVEKVVVASNIGGIPEIIDDGKNGFLCIPGDEKDLTDKLSLLLSDDKLRKEMSRNAFQKVVKRFSVKVMISKLEELFQK